MHFIINSPCGIYKMSEGAVYDKTKYINIPLAILYPYEEHTKYSKLYFARLLNVQFASILSFSPLTLWNRSPKNATFRCLITNILIHINEA